ncbi:hypothetical protein N798_00210 [Knoellia flava TL1]|uniref:Uncharacterized protein n=2 Tax=Knoellia flava TaxID=913969 RepID=A0A8H9FT57_9MICO|nr:hypothetical protein [Knoellia flava]KGN36006.1 hypothetical protein N798_00210 [Knoellia flava TL1]GGB81431.1 hypothetical protein GCM10011314_21300 [Knoellia flava]
MATRTAWTQLYMDVLHHRLGLNAVAEPGHLHVTDGSDWHYLLATDPDTTPHHLQISFPVSYGGFDVLDTQPRLMGSIGIRLNTATDLVKVAPTSPTGCLYIIHAHLAAPGTLPSPDLLAALLPSWFALLVDAHQQLLTEIEAATLYSA